MKYICESFTDCSADIKRWLTKQPEVKEESLTDRFLYELSEKIPAIKYVQFTRRDEGGKTGADWEWWFVFSNMKSFAARVQAKNLKFSVDNYPGIAYTSNDMLQIDRLLADSARDGFASFYCFYSSKDGDCAKCPMHRNDGGVFIGKANNLRSEFIHKARRKLIPSDILKLTNPVSCFFCCPTAYLNNDSLEEGFQNYIRTYFPTISNNRESDNNDNKKKELGFRDTPNHILELLADGVPGWWAREYRSSFTRTKAIVVIDLR